MGIRGVKRVDGGGKSEGGRIDLAVMRSRSDILTGGLPHPDGRGVGNDGRGAGRRGVMNTVVERFINERKDRGPVVVRSPMAKENKKRKGTREEIYPRSDTGARGGSDTVKPGLKTSDKADMDREHRCQLKETGKKGKRKE